MIARVGVIISLTGNGSGAMAMQTDSDVIAHSLRAIQCPSCLQTVTPSIGDGCPACKGDLSILVTLRKVIDRLNLTQSDASLTQTSAATRSTAGAVEAIGDA